LFDAAAQVSEFVGRDLAIFGVLAQTVELAFKAMAVLIQTFR
jgi:hypothetical protein